MFNIYKIVKITHGLHLGVVQLRMLLPEMLPVHVPPFEDETTEARDLKVTVFSLDMLHDMILLLPGVGTQGAIPNLLLVLQTFIHFAQYCLSKS